eukprot:5054683-Pyramimonas_sp.AAC.1
MVNSTSQDLQPVRRRAEEGRKGVGSSPSTVRGGSGSFWSLPRTSEKPQGASTSGQRGDRTTHTSDAA